MSRKIQWKRPRPRGNSPTETVLDGGEPSGSASDAPGEPAPAATGQPPAPAAELAPSPTAWPKPPASGGSTQTIPGAPSSPVTRTDTDAEHAVPPTAAGPTARGAPAEQTAPLPAGSASEVPVASSPAPDAPVAQKEPPDVQCAPPAVAPLQQPTDRTVLHLPDDPLPLVAPPPALAGTGAYSGRRQVAGFLVSMDRRTLHPLFDGKTKLGRDPARDIVLADPKCSFQQCSIVIDASSGRVTVQPAEASTNPTLVDGKPVDIAERIKPPARITIGDTDWVLLVIVPTTAPFT